MEYIVFVNPDGTPTGEIGPKLESHTADTRLHLAFSCYVFNKDGKVLVTRRADTKKVWPGVWTNSVCGHPGPDEPFKTAILRRLHEELGMTADNIRVMLPKYTYKTPPYKGIIEHEFCPVFFADTDQEPSPNPDEVAEYKWMEWDEFTKQASSDTDDTWSWWCKDQLTQIGRIVH
jgi:isopentenyl-diphosphate delta-isomerase